MTKASPQQRRDQRSSRLPLPQPATSGKCGSTKTSSLAMSYSALEQSTGKNKALVSRDCRSVPRGKHSPSSSADTVEVIQRPGRSDLEISVSHDDQENTMMNFAASSYAEGGGADPRTPKSGGAGSVGILSPTGRESAIQRPGFASPKILNESSKTPTSHRNHQRGALYVSRSKETGIQKPAVRSPRRLAESFADVSSECGKELVEGGVELIMIETSVKSKEEGVHEEALTSLLPVLDSYAPETDSKDHNGNQDESLDARLGGLAIHVFHDQEEDREKIVSLSEKGMIPGYGDTDSQEQSFLSPQAISKQTYVSIGTQTSGVYIDSRVGGDEHAVKRKDLGSPAPELEEIPKNKQGVVGEAGNTTASLPEFPGKVICAMSELKTKNISHIDAEEGLTVSTTSTPPSFNSAVMDRDVETMKKSNSVYNVGDQRHSSTEIKHAYESAACCIIQ